MSEPSPSDEEIFRQVRERPGSTWNLPTEYMPPMSSRDFPEYPQPKRFLKRLLSWIVRIIAVLAGLVCIYLSFTALSYSPFGGWIFIIGAVLIICGVFIL